MSSRFKPVLLCVIVSLIFTACFPTGYKETEGKNGKQEELSIEELNSPENEGIFDDKSLTSYDITVDLRFFKCYFWHQKYERSFLYHSNISKEK